MWKATRSRGWRLLALPAAAAALGLVAIGASEFGPRLAWRSPEVLEELPDSAPPASVEWMVVVGRRPEKQTASDFTNPHRNSSIALYQRTAEDHWKKVRGDLMCRSSSTTLQRPTSEDLDTVKRVMEQDKTSSYTYGHASVPSGLYWLIPATWKTGQPAFRISDLNNRDGYIFLKEEQQLRKVAVEAGDGSTSPTLVDVSGADGRRHKSSVYLHPTVTTYWSHIDSQGCINLHQPSLPDGAKSDYDKFIGWINDCGASEGGRPLLLLVKDFEEIAGSAMMAELPAALEYSVAGEGVVPTETTTGAGQ